MLATLTQSASGNQQVTVRLHPVELGMVQISIDRAPSGHALVSISADRAATLHALQADQAALHHALDQAGVPGTGRTVLFHEVHNALAAPHTGTSAGTSTGGSTGGSTGDPSSQGQNRPSATHLGTGGHQPGPGEGQGRGQSMRREAGRWQTTTPQVAIAGASNSLPPSPRTMRIGLDITA